MSMLDQTRRVAHSLRMFGVHAHAEMRAQEALAQNLHPLEFLALILDDEQRSRKESVAKRLLNKAKFRHGADLEDWDESFERGLPKARLKELALLSFFHRKENLLLYGKTGSGKTHIATALGRRLCQEGHQVLFFSVNLLFEEVAAHKASGKYLFFLNSLAKTGVVILDDFGLRSYSHEEATVLMDLLEGGYGKNLFIVTSQVDKKGWSKLFEDAVIAEALVDRLVNPSQAIVLSGGSYREKIQGGQAAKKQKSVA